MYNFIHLTRLAHLPDFGIAGRELDPHFCQIFENEN